MERIDILAALSQVSGIRFEDIAHINLATLEAKSAAAWEEHGLTPRAAALVVRSIESHDPQKYRDLLDAAQCRVIGIGDPDYPSQLLQLYCPPFVLYVRGNIDAVNAVAVVGTRKLSPYGRQVVESMVPVLVAGGCPVVSGLAVGVDTLAHVVTLRCGGRAIAVLGSGLDRVYPAANKGLAECIVEAGGCLISEYRPGVAPLRHHFPARNRIISGLSRGVVIVEGDEHSGAIITAEHAIEQGRDVFAVPGNIFSPQSRGTNQLIAQGAIPLISPVTLQQWYNFVDKPEPANSTLSPDAELIIAAMAHEPRAVDEIAIHSGLPITIVAAKLVELEISGDVQRLPGGLYIHLKHG